MRKAIYKIGQDFQAISVGEVRKAFLTLSSITGVTVIIGGIAYISSSSKDWALSFIISAPLLAASVLIYFFFSSVLTIFINSLGEKIVRISDPASSYRPNIKHWFVLQSQNDLKLYIQNPKGSKEVNVECRFENFTDIRGRSYMTELGYRHELKLAAPSYGANPPIFSDRLVANDTRLITVGIPHNGKIALYFSDAPVYNFRDGTFEYKIGCIAKYLNRRFAVPSFRIWLVIKNGVLVEIKEDL